MKRSKYEMETILLYNEEESTASVYTHDPKLIAKLERLCAKYPNLVYPDRKEHEGAVSYIVPKRCVGVREPYSAERRKADSQLAKAAGRMYSTCPTPTAEKTPAVLTFGSTGRSMRTQ